MRRVTTTILLSLLSFCVLANGINDNETKKEKKKDEEVKQGQLYMAPLPVLASNPAFGFIYGFAASGGMFLGDPSTTKMSSALVTATYSTKKQLMFTIKSNAYSANNEWFFQGDWRLFYSSQPTYGLGTGPQSDILVTEDGGFKLGDYKDGVHEGELMEFDLVRFHQTALKQIKPNVYLGLGYHLDMYSNINDQLLDLESDPQVITNHYAYSQIHGFDHEGYTTSGVSLNAVYDSRDNVANPYTGRFLNAQFRYMPTWLGSDQTASTLWLEYRDYFSLSKKNPRNVLAIWTYGNFHTSGNLPYMALPSLGWDQMGRSGRAFPQGRFRGNDIFYSEIEWRIPVPIIQRNKDLLGAVVFANCTTVSSHDLNVQLFDHLKAAVGVGARVMINKRSRTNLALDYGWGSDGAGAFYLSLNEYF
ncbi:outer membrane protein assembly factor [Flammeovirga yaeyamensis]|uniref:Outer membrane protein assembly factor n=1 Tax=Flammeovirga yaeyamensis TaxID=367791 RepID=A0AAX1N868_9BACT|nr:BamA/TamA family outer membrane protein [Flammeovirga yaeyamensis]MBB3698898.1 hypothetical protein [Flammeovirga yaeyamensis]NMF36333.1 BamA/TamA family outer membrane protein [Flammeovirga yaeyamensis]QWG03706.1 outer membrane protein assembly factor [Flammeovirga yaeyamensis]